MGVPAARSYVCSSVLVLFCACHPWCILPTSPDELLGIVNHVIKGGFPLDCFNPEVAESILLTATSVDENTVSWHRSSSNKPAGVEKQ